MEPLGNGLQIRKFARVSAWALSLAINALLVSSVSAFDFDIKLPGLGLIEELADHPEIAAFYRERGFAPIWTSGDQAAQIRLQTLMDSVSAAPNHGLPYGQNDLAHIRSLINLPDTVVNRAAVEAQLSEIYVRLATSLSSGAIDPRSVDSSIARESQPPDVESLLRGISGPDPAGYLRNLVPNTLQYVMLRRELKRLDRLIETNGWGDLVEAELLQEGDEGLAVVQLRNRLIRMGYMRRTPDPRFTASLSFAVKRFQKDHGLTADGIADTTTLEAVNIEPQQRRRQVVAALERERWLNHPLGDKHIRVNIADFHADVISAGKSIFTTRVVVGQSQARLQTPEFSDQMTHMVINPTWYVPRSITTKEILPQLQEDPAAEPQLQMFTQEDGIIDRRGVDFLNYTAANFPYDFKQPPGPKNALGEVKFMFPNRFNVYMHDTPQRTLFQREIRNYSHGCIRVHRAEEFAEFLLSRSIDDPQSYYHSIRDSGKEQIWELPAPLPVHITYRTAFLGRDGRMHYRDDIYGRDQTLYERLTQSVPLIGRLSV